MWFRVGEAVGSGCAGFRGSVGGTRLWAQSMVDDAVEASCAQPDAVSAVVWAQVRTRLLSSFIDEGEISEQSSLPADLELSL